MTPPVPLVASPWVGLGIVLGLLLLLMLLVRVFQVVARPHPEVPRKMFHVGGGLVAAAMPWLLSRPWPIVAVGLVSAGAFVLLRVVPWLNASLGQVLGGVKRVSLGEFCFLAAVVLLFPLSGRAPVLFAAPILVLAIADAAAALVGVGYGKVHFPTVEGGRKSAEGSLTFLVAAFLCVQVPLLLWSNTGRAECLLVAFDVALVAMMAEAVAWRGLDNFIIPFFGFLLLRTYLRLPLWQLGVHAAVLTGLFLFVYLWRRRTNLAANARLGGVLFGYVVWALAGWQWLVPPLLLFSTYRWLSPDVDRDRSRHINFPVVASLLLPPLGWVALAWFQPSPAFFRAYAAMFAAHLAVIALVRDKHVKPAARWPVLVPLNLARGALLLVPAALLAAGLALGAALHFAVGLAAIALALVAFCLLQPALETYPLGPGRWIRQAACVTGASLLCLWP